MDTSRALLLGLAPPGTQQPGCGSQQSPLSIAVINKPSVYNEPYHDARFPAAAVDSSHLTAFWKSNVVKANRFPDHVISITNGSLIVYKHFMLTCCLYTAPPPLGPLAAPPPSPIYSRQQKQPAPTSLTATYLSLNL